MKFYHALLLYIISIFIIFKSWFSTRLLSGGDWIYLFPKSIQEISPFSSWDLTFNGMGWSIIPTLWVQSYSFSTLKLAQFISWILYERVFWFFPIILISSISSFTLALYITKDRLISLISCVIFLFNTYILLLISGGQTGVAMGYSLTPVVILTFIKALDKNRILHSLIFTLMLALQMIFDIRVAYVSLIAVFVYFLLSLYTRKTNLLLSIKLSLKNLLLPLIVAFLLHSFWILPMIFSNINAVGQYSSAYNTIEGVRFFSFAKFENAIGLMHPNWPENIFGKVGFMKPEFLILPLLAYSSLLFIKKEEKKKRLLIISFSVILLLAIFFAKGANEPFGQIYLWLFENIPGFIMFRDPTKWYTLIAVSYSILIPFTISSIYHSNILENIRMKIKIPVQKLFLAIIVLYLLFLIRPALFGQLGGTFKPTKIPDEYIKLKDFIYSQNTFFRTFWIPTTQRFGYSSNLNPSINAQTFLKTTDYPEIFKKMQSEETKNLLQESVVKYVIVPYDSKGEIFLEDRRYNDKLYKQTRDKIGNISYLKKVSDFGRIAVFELSDYRDHFWNPDNSLDISYQYKNPTKYFVSVEDAGKGDLLVFSESFDKNWVIKNSDFRVVSSKFNDRFNSFELPKSGNYTFEVYYTPQDWVNIGVGISVLTLLSVIGSLIYLKRK